jgi:hypothetical protein
MPRWGLAVLSALAMSGLSAGCSSPSVAKYPYCLMTSDGERDCRYASLEQCEVTRAGVGGSCDQSPYYTGGTAQGSQPAQGVPPPPGAPRRGGR